jgi:hypothetical protein
MLPAAALVGGLVAGCSPGSMPPASSAAAAGPATPVATEAASPAATAVPPDGPPTAYLRGAGLGDPGIQGAEGSFTWNGSGSDAPWIVQPEPDARGAGPWTIALDPQLPVDGWTARWAPVRSGVAGDPAAGARGAGPDIVVEAPRPPGIWSLQLEASFGVGQRAAWYWTVDVSP